MGWDSNKILFDKIPKLLGQIYVGYAWADFTSFSPIIIRHRSGVTEKHKRIIAKMFPKKIRVEFQETNLISGTVILGKDDEYIQAYWGVELNPNYVKTSMFETGIIGDSKSCIRILKVLTMLEK